MRNESSLNEKSFTDLLRIFFPEDASFFTKICSLESLREVPIAIVGRSILQDASEVFFIILRIVIRKKIVHHC